MMYSWEDFANLIIIAAIVVVIALIGPLIDVWLEHRRNRRSKK